MSGVFVSTVCAVLTWQVPYSADSTRSAHSAQSPHSAHSAHFPQSPHSAHSAYSGQSGNRAALEREAEELARGSLSLLAELERFEQERDRQAGRVRDAERAMAASTAALATIDDRLAALQQQRLAQTPELERQFVELYKRGRQGYLPVLAGATSVRDFARASRAVGALARIDEQTARAQRQTLEAIGRERAAQAEQLRIFEEQRLAAEQARTAAEAAVMTRAGLLRQIDARRDLTARLAGEVQASGERLQQQIAALASPSAIVTAGPAPLADSRRALEWPVTGRISRGFGQRVLRAEEAATRNGVEIAASAGTPVRAVHPGIVAYAEPFTGFGTLVILDHGGNSYTLYGYLAGVGVRRGDRVEGGRELGRVGESPEGVSALYFEVRIDGRPVDPVQWLKPR